MSVNVSGITGPQPNAVFHVPTTLYVQQVPPVPVRPKLNMERTWVPPRVPQQRTSSVLLKAELLDMVWCNL